MPLLGSRRRELFLRVLEQVRLRYEFVAIGITPRVLTDALAAGGSEAKRAFDAMMTMKKIDVAAIEAARRG
jgi:hypothetical protein